MPLTPLLPTLAYLAGYQPQKSNQYGLSMAFAYTTRRLGPEPSRSHSHLL